MENLIPTIKRSNLTSKERVREGGWRGRAIKPRTMRLATSGHRGERANSARGTYSQNDRLWNGGRGWPTLT
jgi:hypothetical protein